jgi:hypothetical protein
MSLSELPDDANALREPADGHGFPSPVARTGSAVGIRTLVAALAAALCAGLVAWSLGNTFRISEVRPGDDYHGAAESSVKGGARNRAAGSGRPFAPGVKLSVKETTRNGIVAYGILGALLSFGLGGAAAMLHGPRSSSRAIIAGVTGTLLAVAGSAASCFVLIPFFLGRMETVDLTLSLLIHLGIWTVLGAASGVAFWIGMGSRGMWLPSLVGGIVGAALGTVLFDVVGAFFPFSHTERPLAEESMVRLAANLVLSLSIVVGIAIVASQEVRPAGKKTKGGELGSAATAGS